MIVRVFGYIVGIVITVSIALFASILFVKPDQKGIDPAIYDDGDGVDVLQVMSAKRSEVSPPNIIVILADDLGYGDVGAYGNQVLSTPEIDKLAEEGMRFTNYYAGSSVCSPSRASLLTGRYPVRTGVTNALQPADGTLVRDFIYQLAIASSYFSGADMMGGSAAVRGLPRSEITIPEALKVGGYRTMGIGKWHLGDFTLLPEYHPFEHGFDEFIGFNMSNDDFPVAFYRGEEEIVKDIAADQSHYTRLFTEAAVEFIERNQAAPFFIYLAHKDPHLPFFPSENFAGKSNGGPYGDAVSEFDWSAGQIVRTLKRLGLEENTLVILTSDNGPWYEGDPGHLRGRKGQSYEGGFSVPFIARWPGKIPADVVSDEPVMATDLFPTFLRLAGVTLPDDRVIDGVNIMPLLNGQIETMPDRPLLFFHDFDLEAIRVGDWKYYNSYSRYVWPVPVDKPDTLGGKGSAARNYTPEGTDTIIPVGPELPVLYNVARDRAEAYNLVRNEPEKNQHMLNEYMDRRNAFYANPRGWLQQGQ